MPVFPVQSWACVRAREAISVRLDGELSELEEAILDAHVDRCEACAAFGADVTATTTALRSAASESLTRPVELPLRRRGALGAGKVTAWVAGAAAAAAALLAVTVLPAQHIEGPPSVQPVNTTNQDLRDLHVLRMAQMKPSGLILSPPARGAEL